MTRNLIVGLIAASALFPRVSLASPFIYQNDDGTQTSRGSNFLDTTRYSIQGYDVLPGAEQILGVQVRWGTGGGTDAVDLLLWIDPDNDGEFTDLSVQRTVAGTVGAAADLNNLPVMDYFFTTPIVLPSGSSFFVGTRTYRPESAVPTVYIAFESNLPLSGRNFGVNYAGVHTGGDLSGGTFFGPAGFGIDQAIRAIAAPTAVPEPTTLVLTGLGLLAAARRKARVVVARRHTDA